ncbi:MAG: B12-binding domain-containing radical SAM protein [Candidatus Bathyarchaeia archaeon]
MRVCLISPPYMSAVTSVVGTSSPPLGLAYLASTIRNKCEVKVVDANILDYGLEDVKRELKAFQPDVVGITSTTPSIYEAYRVAEAAKDVREDCVVVLGGPHVTFLPEETLTECGNADVIVRGEGEETFCELVDIIERGGSLENVRGITYRKGDMIISTMPRPFIKNIDEIPFPSLDLLPVEKYELGGIRYLSIISSRGCPFKCSFCASSRLFGSCWRGRSPANVVEELRLVHDKFRIKNIEFADDTFTLNGERAEKICDEILREGLDISWGASSRVDTINRRLAEKMRRAGCWIAYLGIESASQKILDAVGKKITVSQIVRAVKALKDAGIQVLGSFILGFPEETLESARQTITFASSLNLDYAQFSILTPYPGTPIYEHAMENNLLITRDWSRFNAVEPVMKLKNLTFKQLQSLFEKAYLTFYMKPKTILKWIRQKQFQFIKSAVKAAINYIKSQL